MTIFKMESLEGRRLLSFSAPITSTGGGDDLKVADLNADRFDDVLVFAGRNSVGVSLSNGDGTFRRMSTLTGLKGSPFIITPTDVNSDGKGDVSASGITATKKGPAITRTLHTTTWLGNGDGTFGPASTRSSSWPYGGPFPPNNPQTANVDFNDDGLLDLASLNGGTGSVGFYLGNADGTYQPRQLFAAGPDPGAVAAGDFNGDGLIDLVVINSPSGSRPTLSVLLNDGDW